MANVIADRVLETSTTTGTASYALLGAVDGFRTFGSVCANNDTVSYYAEDVDGSGRPTGIWETGVGTWLTGNTLARTAIEASTTGSIITWSSGTRRIALSLNANLFKDRSSLVPTTVKTSAYTAVHKDLVRVNSTGGAFTVNAPASPVDGMVFGVLDVTGLCATNPVLIGSNGSNIESDATGLSLDINGGWVELIYSASVNNWKLML